MDLHRETKLMQKIQICIEKLENFTFYHVLLYQVQTPHMSEAFFRCWKPWVVLFYQSMSKANWRTECLNNIVLFGNRFGTYEQHVSEFRSSTLVDSLRHILAVRKFMREFAMKTVSDDYFGAFHDLSWHFLSLVA
ncbi:hypothetical protein AAG906_019776 [Vitis piasezkii]